MLESCRIVTSVLLFIFSYVSCCLCLYPFTFFSVSVFFCHVFSVFSVYSITFPVLFLFIFCYVLFLSFYLSSVPFLSVFVCILCHVFLCLYFPLPFPLFLSIFCRVSLSCYISVPCCSISTSLVRHTRHALRRHRSL